MKLLRSLTASAALSLLFVGVQSVPAQAGTVYKLSTSYGHGEFRADGEWLCVKDDKADGKGVKIVLSWYDNGQFTKTVKAAPSAEPGICHDFSMPEGQQMYMTLSRTDGSGAVGRTVYA